MIAVFLANGFEEIEALAVVDILRRAELEVLTVGVGNRCIKGAHGITVLADISDEELVMENIHTVILPGGMPGTLQLEHAESVQKAIRYAVDHDLYIGAICAAPSILGHLGLLKGKKAVCFPGYEQELTGAEVSDESVVVDGKLITAKGAGVAIDFGLRIVSELISPSRAELLKGSLQCH